MVLAILFLILSIPCHGAETDDVRDFVDEESLWEYAPEEMRQYDISVLTKSENYARFWNLVREFFTSALSLGIRDGAKLLARVCGILLLGAILRAMEDKSGKSTTQSAFRFLYLLALTMIVYNGLYDALIFVTDTIDAVCAFLTASLPVSSMLLAMSGEVERATLQGVSLQHVIGIFSVITSQVLSPLTRFLLALTLAGSFAGEGIGALTQSLAKFLKRSCLFLFSMLSAILALQNALAAAADTIAMRGVRFAAGSFIPVVGNLVGEASRTIAAGIDLVKKECGMICVLILAYLLARPLIILLVQKMVLSASSMAGTILGDKDGAGFLGGITAVWDLMLAIIAFQGCYCLFNITLFLGGGNTT